MGWHLSLCRYELLAHGSKPIAHLSAVLKTALENGLTHRCFLIDLPAVRRNGDKSLDLKSIDPNCSHTF